MYNIIDLNIQDKHISLIKSLEFRQLDLSSNKITSEGLKELINFIPEYSDRYISIINNNIGDEGIEIVCNNIDKFVLKIFDDNKFIINLKSIYM